MLAYKGFDRALKCRGYQYAIGESYAEESAALCAKGFHACLDPVDVLNYYPPATSRCCIVEIEGVDDRREDDTKVCGTKITIVRELTVAEFIEASAEYTSNEVAKAIGEGPVKAQSSGYRGHAQSSGDRGHAQSSGEHSIAVSLGFYGTACVDGKAEYIVLAEHDDRYNLIGVRVGRVGVEIERGKTYRLTGGAFVEVTT